MKRTIALYVVTLVLGTTALSSYSQSVDTGLPKPGWQTNETALRPLAFGASLANGLRAACYLVPAKDTYGEGECLRRHLVFHNSGKESIVFSVRAAGDDDLCTCTDGQGHAWPQTHVAYTSISPTETFRLEPGEVVDMDRIYTTVIGGRSTGEPLFPSSTFIRARPGTVCCVSWGLRAMAANAPLAIKTGQVSFRIRAKDN